MSKKKLQKTLVEEQAEMIQELLGELMWLGTQMQSILDSVMARAVLIEERLAEEHPEVSQRLIEKVKKELSS